MPVALALMLAGCADNQPTPADLIRESPAPEVLGDLPPQVRAFIEQKEAQARKLATKLGVEPDRATLEYFRLARAGRYRAASHIYQDLRERGGKVQSSKYDPHLRLPLWDPLLEVQLTLDAYAAGAGKFATALGDGIVRSLPPGSIYFGGTDSGRGLAAAFCRSGVVGESFIVLTQNQLADGQHMAYLRATYGEMIYIPSNEDAVQAFEAYVKDATRRYQHDQSVPHEPRELRPGEDVKMMDGKPQVSGQVAVMAINGLLAKVLFDKNPEREFFVEESFPLEWMYAHLTPHGLIMKVNRQPLAELTAEILKKDNDFWRARQVEFIGGWLVATTSVQEVCDFVERVFVRKDLTGFKGDPDFVRSQYATASFSKLRSSQAGLYAWRVGASKSAQERERMAEAADFAFRQSFAFCPTSPEAVYRYVNLLLPAGRVDEALLIARTARKLKPTDEGWTRLVSELEQIAKANGVQPLRGL